LVVSPLVGGVVSDGKTGGFGENPVRRDGFCVPENDFSARRDDSSTPKNGSDASPDGFLVRRDDSNAPRNGSNAPKNGSVARKNESAVGVREAGV
jgi:hypothetical protein